MKRFIRVVAEWLIIIMISSAVFAMAIDVIRASKGG